MLTRFDETLRHQTSSTFDAVASSDPRFFDRQWFTVYDPAGSLLLVMGMGLYSNTDVMDGFAAVQQGTRQHNLRLSRRLRPAIDQTMVGPLHTSVVEPFSVHRLELGPLNPAGTAVDLTWTAVLPPHLEPPHQLVSDGRVIEDYSRYDQIGTASGRIAVAGQWVDVDGWWAARDHSWGVRPGVGGIDRARTSTGLGSGSGRFAVWFLFSTADLGGLIHILDVDGQRRRLHGVVQWPDGRETAVCDVALDVRYHPGTCRFSSARLAVTSADGCVRIVEARPLLGAWSMDGTGYDGGFDDGLGLGVFRGEEHVEADVYDLSDPEQVVRPDGSRRSPRQRETPVSVLVDGQAGTGHLVIMATGPLSEQTGER